jgi:hypothetical protein
VWATVELVSAVIVVLVLAPGRRLPTPTSREPSSRPA